jgi:hypothetical protein
MTETLPEVDPDEFLERFVSENWITKTGALKWQAIQIHKKDEGLLSVARLNADPNECLRNGRKMNSFKGFAETLAQKMIDVEHPPSPDPQEDFDTHAVLDFTDVNPEWPVPYEVGAPSEAKIAEMDYYKALLPHFRLIEVPDASVETWGAERLGA